MRLIGAFLKLPLHEAFAITLDALPVAAIQHIDELPDGCVQLVTLVLHLVKAHGVAVGWRELRKLREIPQQLLLDCAELIVELLVNHKVFQLFEDLWRAGEPQFAAILQLTVIFIVGDVLPAVDADQLVEQVAAIVVVSADPPICKCTEDVAEAVAHFLIRC